MAIKISVIGAGSAVFSLSLIRDICTTENLHGCIISLMDINEARLNAAYKLCVRYAKEQSRSLVIEKTTSRAECLAGASFVINTAMHVNYDMWKRGWKTAEDLGYRYGGSLHIMHDEAFWINFYQFKLIDSVYSDMQLYCKDAWYLIVSNPVLASVTWMKRKYPDSKIVGLCHGYNGVYPIAEMLGFKDDDVRFELSGVNHFVFMNYFSLNGQDGFKALDEYLSKNEEKLIEESGFCSLTGPKILDIYKTFEVYPIGDTGNPGGGAWGWWYHTDKNTENRWKDDPSRWFKEIYFEANERMVSSIASAAEDESVRVSDIFPPQERVHEPMIPLIESIAFDIPRVIIVNIQNDKEYVAGVPKDFEVEIPALCSANGIQGIACKPLPKPVIALLLRDRVAPVELELAAFEQGSYNLLLQLVLTDPWTKSEEQARNLIDNILNMPELEEMKLHYK